MSRKVQFAVVVLLGSLCVGGITWAQSQSDRCYYGHYQGFNDVMDGMVAFVSRQFGYGSLTACECGEQQFCDGIAAFVRPGEYNRIWYDEDALIPLTSRSITVQFVVAHEVGHHLYHHRSRRSSQLSTGVDTSQLQCRYPNQDSFQCVILRAISRRQEMFADCIAGYSIGLANQSWSDSVKIDEAEFNDLIKDVLKVGAVHGQSHPTDESRVAGAMYGFSISHIKHEETTDFCMNIIDRVHTKDFWQ